MHGNTLNPDAKPAPPSREAEIAAEQLRERIEKHVLGNQFGADDVDVWNDAERWIGEALSPLLAHLQQARDALDHYGQHRPDCPTVDEDGNFHPVLCTCGLDAALMAVR